MNPHVYSSLDFESFQYSFKNGFIIKTWLKIDILYYAEFTISSYIFVWYVVKMLSILDTVVLHIYAKFLNRSISVKPFHALTSHKPNAA